MRFKNYLVVLYVLVLFFIEVGTATTITLNLTNDTWVNSSSPTSNYGTSGYLQLRDHTGAIYRMYGVVPTSSIPEGASISNATLQYYVYSAGSTVHAKIYEVFNDSVTESITYNTQPCPGANCNSTSESTINVDSIGNKTFNITYMFKQNHANSSALHFSIRTNESSTKTPSGLYAREIELLTFPIVTIEYTSDTTPPASITNLTNTTDATSITWSWTNPLDVDFSYIEIWINEVFVAITSLTSYVIAELEMNTTHNISTRTVDTAGNKNTTWVNQSTFLNYSLIPQNTVRNGGFESGTENWTFYTNGSGSFTTITPAYLGSKTAKVSITTAGTNVQLYQNALNLTENQPYRIKFSANSSTGNNVLLRLMKHSSPYTNYYTAEVNLTSTMTDYVIDFGTTGLSGTSSDVRLSFDMSSYDADGDVYHFDGIELYSTFIPADPVFTYNYLAYDQYLNETVYNHAWSPGTGNRTDYYNVSLNGVNTNLTTQSYVYGYTDPGSWVNLTVCSYNVTGYSSGCITNNTQAPSLPVQTLFTPEKIYNGTFTVNATVVRLQWSEVS